MDEDSLHLVNEYADVRLRIVRTGCGARLEIVSGRTGHRLVVDATGLEAIASLGPDDINALVGLATERDGAAGAFSGDEPGLKH